MSTQSNMTFEEISQIIYRHLLERDWHNQPSRGLATSIVLEATELLEHYQWTDKAVGSKEELAGELADIFIYAFQFAQNEGIDIPAAITAKLAKSAEKYPAANFKGKKAEARNEEWYKAKLKHQKTGL